MSRPLISKKKFTDKNRKQRMIGATEFHSRVFAKWGSKCYRTFSCSEPATDAAHIIPRSKLGPHRYACPEENGRPLCRDCHEAQEAGVWDFSLTDRRRAIAALNKLLKQKLVAA